jgi:hypothetical protein
LFQFDIEPQIMDALFEIFPHNQLTMMND